MWSLIFLIITINNSTTTNNNENKDNNTSSLSSTSSSPSPYSCPTRLAERIHSHHHHHHHHCYHHYHHHHHHHFIIIIIITLSLHYIYTTLTKNLLPLNRHGETHTRDDACNRLCERYTGTVTYKTVIRVWNKGPSLFRHIVVLQ